MKLSTLFWFAAGVAAHGHHHQHLHEHFRERRNDDHAAAPMGARSVPAEGHMVGAAAVNSPKNTRAVQSATVQSTILVIARDQSSANSASSGLNGYGIPFQTLIVPQSGTTLPALNSSSTVGNFGGIIVASGIAYDYGGTTGWQSALTQDQWNTLYAYQTAFGVRMVQYDVYPQPQYGTSVLGGCCNSGVEHLVSFSNTTGFPQAGIKSWAGVTTQGLYHYAAQVSDPTTTWEIAQFAPNSQFTTNTTAAVINNFNGRQQMVFFISWATDWSPTSNFLQHAYITWMTRGLYAGYRRVNLNTQIDDMFLYTDIYYPGNQTTNYRVTPTDMDVIKSWVPTIQAKMNPGSWYKPEIGHNGDGNIIAIDSNGSNDGICNGGPIYVNYYDTPLEFKKPLGTGTDGWPTTPTTYAYSNTCLNKDALKNWFATASNRDTFLHISHTFTHEGQDNATYNDIYKEINWNQQWLSQVSIASGNFTANGIIPPAITGLHNGDALQAWWDNGIRNCVGDNSRPPLVNQQNSMWPYITSVANDGFAGMTVIPRWPLRIYYNCDTPACTLQEWIDTSAGTGDFNNLMAQEKADTMRHFFGLRRDGNMFHQLNLRSTGMSAITTPYGTSVYTLLQAWVEQTVYEFTRLVNWPMQTLKQSDLAIAFTNRMTRDGCGYTMTYSVANNAITGVTVGATGNTCSAAIPVTVPGSVTNTQGFALEKVGNDPLTIWVKLSGSPVTFTLSSPVAL